MTLIAGFFAYKAVISQIAAQREEAERQYLLDKAEHIEKILDAFTSLAGALLATINNPSAAQGNFLCLESMRKKFIDFQNSFDAPMKGFVNSVEYTVRNILWAAEVAVENAQNVLGEQIKSCTLPGMPIPNTIPLDASKIIIAEFVKAHNALNTAVNYLDVYRSEKTQRRPPPHIRARAKA